MFVRKSSPVWRSGVRRRLAPVLLKACLLSAALFAWSPRADACMSGPPSPPPVLCTPIAGGTVKLTFGSYTTFGSNAGQFCACALKMYAGQIASVDAVVVSGPSGFLFSGNATTSSSASSVLGATSGGFLASMAANVAAGQNASIQFTVTLVSGLTCADLQGGLCGAGNGPALVTDEGQSNGALLGSHQAAPPCGTFTTGGGSGDPHLRTFDDVAYDFQAIGEFDAVTTEDPSRYGLQIRTERYVGQTSVITAAAMNVNGDRLGFYTRPDNRILLNGKPIELTCSGPPQIVCEPSASLPKGGIVRQPPSDGPGKITFEVTWPEGDVIRLRVRKGYMDLKAYPPAEPRGRVSGLLGAPDGDPFNDLTTRGGLRLPLHLSFSDLYHRFGDGWRITDETSLFDYEPGLHTSDYTDLSAPEQLIGTEDLDPVTLGWAREACVAAGITTPILLDNCSLDVAMMGDAQLVDSYSGEAEPLARARIEPDSEESLTSLEGSGCTLSKKSAVGAAGLVPLAIAVWLGLRRRREARRGGAA